MAVIPDDKLQEVKDRIDIVDLVGRYVGLRRSGKNFSACCPFHDERTPSFYVNPDRRSYKCFGCGVGGDGIDFVMRIEGKSFLEATRRLAEIYGVHLPQLGGARGERLVQEEAERDQAYAIARFAAEHFRETLLRRQEGAAGRVYQAERRISPEIAETFALGYAPSPSEAGWDHLTRALTGQKFSMPLAEKLGLVGRSERTGAYFDRFRGRLIFPIIQPGGAVVAFSGRILPLHADAPEDGREPPKYINSPESLLYTKGKTLFGLHAAAPLIRQRGRAILVEGNVDVLAMHQKGFGEAVAPLGTALTEAQLQVLRRFTEGVVVCFDGDRAGRKAALEATSLLLGASMEPRIALLGEGEDPDVVPQERLAGLFDRPAPAIEWLLQRMVSRGAAESIEAQEKALDVLIPLLLKVQRDSTRELYLDLAAKLLNIAPRRISSRLRGDPRPPPSQPVSRPPPEHRPAPLPEVQVELVALLADNPHMCAVAEREGALEELIDPRLRRLARAITDAAKRGEHPGEGDLLDGFELAEQRPLHDKVFCGTYRGTELDLVAVLQELLAVLRRERTQRQIGAIDDEMIGARQRGELDRLRALTLERVALRRQLDNFRLNPTNPAVQADPVRT
ncbi:MAG: DNA primase [Nannocystis sp.]|jgi:DNA primase|nr:DNA primase [Nannocystis sp.]